MKKHKVIMGKFSLLIILTALLVSCDFESINTPVNNVSDEEMNRDNMKAGAMLMNLQNWVIPTQENAFQQTESLLGDVYGRYMMTTNDRLNNQNFSIFTASDPWINWPFKNVLPNIYTNWNKIKDITGGKGVIYEWAQLLRVASMQRITDTYGPIPYSKVETGELKVPYDSQEEVYKVMFGHLTQAISVLTSATTGGADNSVMKDFDLVYGGDFTKWVKFANSLKLRMAMRIRFAAPALAKEMAEEAVLHPLGIIAGNADNASIEPPTKGNPLYIMWDTYHDTRVCADIAALMNGYNDPRRDKYFQIATINSTTGYLGLRSGANIKNVAWGTAYSAPVAEKADRLMWMSAAEVAFLKAEGALAGWSMGGTAEEFYKQGVKLSFEQWGASGADSYLEDATSKQEKYTDPNNLYSCNAVNTITIKWVESDTAEKKLERVITQKWLAMWPNGQEAWSEHRRTGYPAFFPVAQNVSVNLKVANRIPFCIDEYKNNSENMPAALQALGGEDNYQTRLWWDVYRK